MILSPALGSRSKAGVKGNRGSNLGVTIGVLLCGRQRGAGVTNCPFDCTRLLVRLEVDGGGIVTSMSFVLRDLVDLVALSTVLGDASFLFLERIDLEVVLASSTSGSCWPEKLEYIIQSILS